MVRWWCDMMGQWHDQLIMMEPVQSWYKTQCLVGLVIQSVRKLDLSHLCFSLNFDFSYVFLQFPSMCEDLFVISSTTHSFSASFPLYHLPPDLNMLLNCSLCNPLFYAYLHHGGYVVLVYHQYTPNGLRTTSCNTWTWIKSHKGDKDLPKALCYWRTTMEDWDYRQQRKTSF